MIERATSNFLKTMKGESFQASGTTGFQRNGCRMQNSSRRISWLMRCSFIHDPRGSDFFSTFSSDKVTLALRGPQRFTVGFSFKEKTFTFCLVRCMAGFTCGRQQRFFHQTASLHLFSLHRGRVETLANVKDNSIDFSRRCTEQHYLFIQGEQFKSPDILHSVQKTLCNVHLQKADSAVTCFLLQVLFQVLQQQTQSSVRQTQLSWTPCTSPSQFTCLHIHMPAR